MAFNCLSGAGRIYKGSIAELNVPFYRMGVELRIEAIKELTIWFYTSGGNSVQKVLSEGGIFIDGSIARCKLEVGELYALPDGLLRYKTELTFYPEEGAEPVTETNEKETRLFLKTPINYDPIDYIDRGELNEALQNIETEIVADIKDEADAREAKDDELANLITALQGADKQLNSKIDALDVADSKETGKMVVAVSQVDGKIAVTRDYIQLDCGTY